MPAKRSTKGRGARGTAPRKPLRAPEPDAAARHRRSRDAASPPPHGPWAALRNGGFVSAWRPAELRSRLRGAVAAESPLWVVLLLVVPILAVFLELTVGVQLDQPPGVDKDYWWHLATGNWILDHHRIPTTDPFSWTHGGQEWIAHEWLAAVLLALLDRVGGYAASIVFTAVVAVAGFWRLLAGARFYGMSRRTAALTMLLFGSVFISRIGVMVVRPQVWSWALLAILCAELAAYDTGRRRRLWILPPLFALWVNINLTALIGFGCLGAFVLDRLIRRPVDRHVVGIGLLSGLALLINPNHLRLFGLILGYLDSDSVWRDYVLEWMPPVWDDPLNRPFWIALVLLVPAVWFLVRPRPFFWPAAPLLVVAYQSFQSIRYIPVYVLIAFVFAGWLVRRWRIAAAGGAEPAPDAPLVPHRPWVLVPVVGASALALLLAITTSPSQLRREPYAWYFPEGATTFYLQNYSGERIFNTYDFGGYLIHRFAGTGNTVYIDGRGEMYGDLQMRRYFYYIDGRPGWQDYFDREGVQVVIVRTVDNLAYQIVQDPGWRLVYADVDLVFVRAELVP